MIFGTPGSGKTTALIVLLKILARMGRRVLIVSFTNSAIDNVLSKLKMSGFNKFVRVSSSPLSVDESIRSNVKGADSFSNMEEIQKMINSNLIFGATCSAVNSDLLKCVKFDYCIMDEASQVNEPLALGPILLAEKFVLIGDYY